MAIEAGLWEDIETAITPGIRFRKSWCSSITLVRPRLQYCIQFLSPHYRKALESMQKRFTRMLLGLACFSYKDRLDELGLFSLGRQRLRGDPIEIHTIMRGIGLGLLLSRVLMYSEQLCLHAIQWNQIIICMNTIKLNSCTKGRAMRKIQSLEYSSQQCIVTVPEKSPISSMR